MTSMGVSNAEIERIQIEITRNAKANADRKRAPVRVFEHFDQFSDLALRFRAFCAKFQL